MPQQTPQFCPFCGFDGLEQESEPAEQMGPEMYYTCPNCGVIGSVGLWRSSVPDPA